MTEDDSRVQVSKSYYLQKQPMYCPVCGGLNLRNPNNPICSDECYEEKNRRVGLYQRGEVFVEKDKDG